MATSPRNVVSLAVAFALAVPALAAAQRTASSSSSSTSSGEVAVPRTDPPSSSGGGSGGGSSASERSTGSSSSQVIVPQNPTFRSSSEFTSSSGQRTAPPGSSTGSTATPRGSSGSSSSSGGSASSSSGGSSGSGSSTSSPRGNDNGVSFGRSRDGRPSAGVATPREAIDINGLSFPVYGPTFARWYPFGTGFGYNFGYVNYDPWFYSRTPWIWGWNGLWYDPYDPFGYNSWYGYNPYAYGYGYGYPGYSNYGGRSSKSSDENDHVGSIRLRANPSKAEVYVDGALMGVVDDFDGFSSHLKLAGGTHTIELKADGYEPYSGNVTVSVGKTVTERISLKKKK